MMNRRTFLKTAAMPALAGRVAFGSEGKQESGKHKVSMEKRLMKRPYGETGEYLSLIGLGGILVKGLEQAQANRIVSKAVELGVNYFDVAPTYGDAEERLGPALEPFRKNVFLACKTTKRDKDGAAEELRQSLRNLRTDHFDLYQLHGLSTMDDAEKVLARGGALETFVEARQSGLIRFIGFSAHSEEASIRVMDEFKFDSILFPFNFVAYYKGSFGAEVLKKAQEKGVARLAIKALARCPWSENNPNRDKYNKCWYEPVIDPDEQELALRWTLSLPVTAAIPPGHEDLFWRAVEIAQEFRPLTESEKADVVGPAQALQPIFRRKV